MIPAMTTTPEPTGEPIGIMEIRRDVPALIVDAVSAAAALWKNGDSNQVAVPDDVRVIVTAVDMTGVEHHLSMSYATSSALEQSLGAARLDALRRIEALS